MLDIKFIRENPELVKENIRKKFQNAKVPLVDEVIALDAERREAINEGEALKAERNKLSKANGPLFGKLKKCADEAEKAAIQAEIDANNAAVKADAERMAHLEEKKNNAEAAMNKLLMVIPQMIDESVPIGPDDSCNVEVERFGEPKTPDFDIPYHTDIMERFNGVDMDAAARVSGSGFYYLMGDIARLHSAVTAYGRDFMIDKGFTYCIPPFMIHGNVVEGVMSQTDMDAMMYKIEGEDLYLIGTSEHSMIGKFIDQILTEDKLPQTLTSYSPCFRKEKGAHGIEERGVYRIHQFEKQEMIVVCKPEESKAWYEKMWRYSVELFRSLDIPVRQLECCSGDLADLKCKSCDIPPPAEVFRGVLLLQLRRRAGAASEDPRPRRGREDVPSPHPEQHRGGSSPYAHRPAGEQPTGGRLRAGAQGVAALYGRQGASCAAPLIAYCNIRCIVYP